MPVREAIPQLRPATRCRSRRQEPKSDSQEWQQRLHSARIAAEQARPKSLQDNRTRAYVAIEVGSPGPGAATRAAACIPPSCGRLPVRPGAAGRARPQEARAPGGQRARPEAAGTAPTRPQVRKTHGRTGGVAPRGRGAAGGPCAGRGGYGRRTPRVRTTREGRVARPRRSHACRGVHPPELWTAPRAPGRPRGAAGRPPGAAGRARPQEARAPGGPRGRPEAAGAAWTRPQVRKTHGRAGGVAPRGPRESGDQKLAAPGKGKPAPSRGAGVPASLAYLAEATRGPTISAVRRLGCAGVSGVSISAVRASRVRTRGRTPVRACDTAAHAAP